MKINTFNIVIALGLIAISGILIVQLLWTKQSFNLEEKKFSQKVYVALLQVVKKLYIYNKSEIPLQNPISKVSNDFYVVNVNDDFEPSVLEYTLKNEFEKANLIIDFEYAVYNCESDEMVYGNRVSFINKTESKSNLFFPKQKGLVYYFAIRFPNETSYLFRSLTFWFTLSIILLFILIIYVYSIFTIIQQRKYSELQKDFINNMTHEFKTPLTSILIASRFLIQQDTIKSNKKLEKYADIIISQSNKLNDHFEKILNIAKSDSTSLLLDKKDISLIPLINDVIENIKLKHEQLNISIKSNVDECIIKADMFHLTNLVYNLIDNSIKYCELSPSIKIELHEKNKQIKLIFIDNGIGISEKYISFIFDKFYRIPYTKINNINGFGLGLYYVKRICTLHNWKISAVNNRDQGITISLLINRQV